MSNLKDLENYICKEFTNLNKSKGRPRTLQGILEKKNNLQESFQKYHILVKSYEKRLNTNEWNELVETYNEVKFKCSLALQILDKSQIIVTSNPVPEPEPAPEPEPGLGDILSTSSSNLAKNLLKVLEMAGDEVEEAPFVFPMKSAIKCIPEFTGSAEELDAFFYQVEVFEELFPRDVIQKPLINVVMLKMRGDAMKFVKRIKSETWAETKAKMIKEFGEKKSMEEIQVKIENFEQGFDETFKSYKERALSLLEDIEALSEEETAYAERCLKIHFLSGLRIKDLKLTGKREKHRNFRDLIEFLETESVESEQMAVIEKRLKVCRLAESKNKFQNEKTPIQPKNAFEGGGRKNYQNNQANFNTNFQNNTGNQPFKNQFYQQGNFNSPNKNFPNQNARYNSQNGNFNNNFGGRNQNLRNPQNFGNQNRGFNNQNSGNFQQRNQNYQNPNSQGYSNNITGCGCEGNSQSEFPNQHNFPGYQNQGRNQNNNYQNQRKN